MVSINSTEDTTIVTADDQSRMAVTLSPSIFTEKKNTPTGHRLKRKKKKGRETVLLGTQSEYSSPTNRVKRSSEQQFLLNRPVKKPSMGGNSTLGIHVYKKNGHHQGNTQRETRKLRRCFPVFVQRQQQGEKTNRGATQSIKLDNLLENYETLRLNVDKSIRDVTERMRGLDETEKERSKNKQILVSLHKKHSSSEDSIDSEDEIWSPVLQRKASCDSPSVTQKPPVKQTNLYSSGSLPQIQFTNSIEPSERRSVILYPTTSNRRSSSMETPSHRRESTVFSTASCFTTITTPQNRSKKSGALSGSLVSIPQFRNRTRYSSMNSHKQSVREDRAKIGPKQNRDLTDFVSKRLDAILSTQRHRDSI